MDNDQPIPITIKGIVLNRDVFVDEGVTIGNDVTIVCRKGGRVIIGKNSYINGGQYRAIKVDIQIGSDCTIGYNVTFVTNYGSHYMPKANFARIKPIVIGKNVWIGDGVKVRGGVTIIPRESPWIYPRG